MLKAYVWIWMETHLCAGRRAEDASLGSPAVELSVASSPMRSLCFECYSQSPYA